MDADRLTVTCGGRGYRSDSQRSAVEGGVALLAYWKHQAAVDVAGRRQCEHCTGGQAPCGFVDWMRRCRHDRGLWRSAVHVREELDPPDVLQGAVVMARSTKRLSSRCRAGAHRAGERAADGRSLTTRHKMPSPAHLVDSNTSEPIVYASVQQVPRPRVSKSPWTPSATYCCR